MVGHDIHAGIEESVGENQIKALESGDIFPQGGLVEIGDEGFGGGGAEEEIEQGGQESAGGGGESADDAVDLPGLLEVCGGGGEILLDGADHEAEEGGEFPSGALAGVVLSAGKESQGGQEGGQSQEAFPGYGDVEEEDASQEGENEGGLDDGPDDAIGAPLHGIGHDEEHEEIQGSSQGQGSAGEQEDGEGAMGEAVRAQQNQKAGCDGEEEAEELHQAGIHALFGGVPHDEAGEAPAASHQHHGKDAEEGRLEEGRWHDFLNPRQVHEVFLFSGFPDKSGRNGQGKAVCQDVKEGGVGHW